MSSSGGRSAAVVANPNFAPQAPQKRSGASKAGWGKYGNGMRSGYNVRMEQQAYEQQLAQYKENKANQAVLDIRKNASDDYAAENRKRKTLLGMVPGQPGNKTILGG